MRALSVVAVLSLLAAPAWGLNYDVKMTSFNANGSLAGNSYSLSQVVEAGSAGTLPVVNGQLTGGEVSSKLRLSGTGGIIIGLQVDIDRSWVMVKDGHPFRSPLFANGVGDHYYDPAQFPLTLNPGDSVPPAMMMGKDGESYGNAPNWKVNLVLWDMTSIASRTALPGGGESIVYNIAGHVNMDTPYGPQITSYAGTMTLESVVPEPAAALLLLAGLPLVRRRRQPA